MRALLRSQRVLVADRIAERFGFKLLAIGPFLRKDVRVSYRPRPADRVAESDADELWTQAQREAAARGLVLHNGPLYRLADWQATESSLLLSLGDTDYRSYVATRAGGASEPADPLALCVALRTSDRRLLVEQRGSVDVYAGRLHVVGGFLERDLDGSGGEKPDLWAAMAREAEEETSFALQPESLTLAGLAYDLRTPHPELCFSGTTSAGLDEVRRRGAGRAEFKDILDVEDAPARLTELLVASVDRISPTGAAALVLHGRLNYGEAWLDELGGRLRA